MTCQVICHKFNNSNNFNKVIRIFIYHNDFFDLDLSIYIIDAFKVEINSFNLFAFSISSIIPFVTGSPFDSLETLAPTPKTFANIITFA